MVGYLKRCAAATIIVTAALVSPALAQPDSGRFVAVSDIHFDPFDPPGLARDLAGIPPGEWMARFAALPPGPASQYGSDTNHVLLSAALAMLGDTGADADFLLYSGDLLSHDFEAEAAKALGVAADSAAQRAFAEATSLFVAEALAAAVPGKPVFLALGNNDSDCGDYEIEPGGPYLSALAETVRRLAGPDRVADDFATTFAAGGYYAAAHPTTPGTLIVVLNDILWSEHYVDACGGDAAAAARGQMDWFASVLDAQAAAGGRVWLVHHIPWGIDPYATEHAKGDTCRARVTPLLKAPFAAEFVALVRAHAPMIDVSLSGHVHTDDYRLLLDDAGRPLAADKVIPAISPVYGQNPAFQVFTYDRDIGTPTDFAAIRLANLPDLGPVDAEWVRAYVFSEAYGVPGYAPESVATLWNGLGQGGRIRDTYADNYNSGHGALTTANLGGYACAIVHLEAGGYSACYCGE
jgi:sphingomyelin phosphodiesterase acid-like 3